MGKFTDEEVAYLKKKIGMFAKHSLGSEYKLLEMGLEHCRPSLFEKHREKILEKLVDMSVDASYDKDRQLVKLFDKLYGIVYEDFHNKEWDKRCMCHPKAESGAYIPSDAARVLKR